ncbi:MAG: YchF/TatD family DNA exonuclease [Candidatus Omnitrophota bacterium]|nr:YchF/TatD family DNA exonuclease [Candidatus Omnitrophota bacterium]
MKLVDTHCHLDFPDYKDDLDDVIKSAENSGVVRLISPGTSIESSARALELAEKYPSVFAAAGVHPHGADDVKDGDMARLREMITAAEKIVAIGEIGLDYYKGYSRGENQRKLFRDCFALAGELDLPLILHNRNADKDVLSVLTSGNAGTLRGVVHCFSGDMDFLEKVLALGMHVSFAGNITFDKAGRLRELASHVPLERLLLETDSPYITPKPFRGKRNEPSFVRYLPGVYEDIYDLPAERIAEATSRNANRLFRLGMEKESTIVYQIRDSLYINVTYRCTNRCTFCTRDISDYVQGYDLKLDRDPTSGEIISSIRDVSRYKEVVFCGFGEPVLRLGVIKKVASYVKAKGGRVRITTNGEGNLINGRSIAPELKGLVDRVAVSLNAPDAETYGDLSLPVFGNRAYGAILEFVTDCVEQGIEVEITCLDMIGEEGVERCRQVAERMGVSFRLRHLHVVG